MRESTNSGISVYHEKGLLTETTKIGDKLTTP